MTRKKFTNTNWRWLTHTHMQPSDVYSGEVILLPLHSAAKDFHPPKVGEHYMGKQTRKRKKCYKHFPDSEPRIILDYDRHGAARDRLRDRLLEVIDQELDGLFYVEDEEA